MTLRRRQCAVGSKQSAVRQATPAHLLRERGPLADYCFLPTPHCLPLTAFCLLLSAYCFLPSAYCRLPTPANPAMKIADVPVENKRVTEAQAIFMQSGGPKAHDISAQRTRKMWAGTVLG